MEMGDNNTVMLAGKVFLESVKAEGEGAASLRVNLVLNDLLYDELKQFHTKYLCLTATDVLTLELYHTESQQLLGTTQIQEVYKHVLESSSIQAKVKSKQFGQIILNLTFAPLTSFNKKKAHSPSVRRIEQTARSPVRQKLTQADMSFSHRDPLLQTQNVRGSLMGTGLADRNMLGELNEGDSLESLAQQREKILGELFGKFKRDR